MGTRPASPRSASRIEIQCGSNPEDVSPRVTVALRGCRDQRGEMAEETRSQVDPLNTELMPVSIRQGHRRDQSPLRFRGVCGRPSRAGFHPTADRASRGLFERVPPSTPGCASASAFAATSRACRPPNTYCFLLDIPVTPGSPPGRACRRFERSLARGRTGTVPRGARPWRSRGVGGGGRRHRQSPDRQATWRR